MRNRLVLVSLGMGIVLLGLVSLSVDASTRVQVGGGAAPFGDGFVPFGRVTVDLLSFDFGTVGAAAEFWYIAGDSQWLYPFVTFTAPVIFEPSLGLAPIIDISSQGIELISIALALKGSAAIYLGPLGLFGEALTLVSPQYGFSGIFLFNIGLTLGFSF